MGRRLAFVLLLALSACGTVRPDAPQAPAPAATPGRQLVVVEGDDASAVVDAATGRTVASLPGGVLSPSLDVVVRVTAGQGKTAVAGVDLAGKPVFGLALSGEYRVPNAYGAAPSGFSPNGKWLVLVSRDASESRFAVIDVAKGALATTVTLGSRFSFDAIHNDGSAMYLIEHPRAGATSYNVRLYVLAEKVLRPDIIFDKAAVTQWDPSVGFMDGTFHVSVAPKTGDWSYGLYMRPDGAPFVHALNVPGRYAQCIVDLGGTWTASSLFSMALSDDGRRLYVVDTAGGTISVIDGLTQKVARKATFGTRGGGVSHATSAVISHDGSRLYATGARGVASIQTADLSLRGWAAPDLAARSLALSADGARLFALADDGMHVIDAASGRDLSTIPVPTGARAIHAFAAADPATRR